MRRYFTLGLGGLTTLFLAGVWLLALTSPVSFRADHHWWPPLLIAFISLLGLAGWGLITRRPHARHPLLFWAVLLVSQGVIAVNWVAVPHADLYFVHQQALNLLAHHTTWSSYFMTYPNNVNLTLLLAGCLKIGRWVTDGDSGIWLNVLQFAWLDLGIAVMAHHLRLNRPKIANTFLGLAWLCVPLYAYGLNTYSDTVVLPAGLITLVLMAHLRQAATWYRWWGWGGLLSLTLTLAYLFKANFIVLIIAVLFILWGLPIAHPQALRAKAALSLLLALSLFGGNLAASAAQRAAGFTANPQRTLPAISWIAMSYNPNYAGNYNRTDATQVIHQPTAQAKQAVAKRHLTAYWHALGPRGLLQHWGRRAQLFLATGTFDAFQINTSTQRSPRWAQQHRATLEWLLANWAQIVYVTLLLINCLWGVSQWRHRRFHPGFLLGGLFALGLTAFHVFIWETEERYALPLLPLLLAGGAVGLNLSHPNCSPRPNTARGLLVAGLVLGLVGLGQGASCLTQPLDKTVIAVSQNEGRYYQNHHLRLAPQQALTQPFRAPVAFTQIRVDPHERRIGQATLTAHGKVVWRSKRHANLSRLTVPRQGPGTYHLTLTNQNATRTLSLTTAPATFPLTTHPLRGHPHQYLRFTVNAPNRSPGLSRKHYGIFAGLISLLALSIGWRYWQLGRQRD